MATTIDDPDIASLESSIDHLLDQTQSHLGYPYEASQRHTTDKPSTQLTYSFTAEIEVVLSTQWELFQGLTLTNIILKTRVDKQKDLGAKLYVSLTAVALIGETSFSVVGLIPRLSNNEPVDFIISVTVLSDLDTIDTESFVTALTGDANLCHNATSKLDSELQGELDLATEGQNLAASATLIISRGTDKAFFLKSFEFALAKDLNWTIVKDAVTLKDAILDFSVTRSSKSVPWQTSFAISGTFQSEQFSLHVIGVLKLGDQSIVYLAVQAQNRGVASLETFMRQVTSTPGEKVASEFENVPSLKYPTGKDDAFSGSLTIAKDANGWYLSQVSMDLSISLPNWRPIKDIDLSLHSLGFELFVQRADVATGTPPSSALLQWEGTVAAKMKIWELDLDASISYDSQDELITIQCSVDDKANMTLNDIGAFSSLNPRGVNSRDLASPQIGILPEAVPVDLTWASASGFGTDKSLTLVTTSSEVKTLSLTANFEMDWHLTTLLKISRMGIYFEIDQPLVSTAPSASRGYAYGEMTVGQSTQIFIFIVANMNPTAAKFQLLLSAKYQPGSAIGVSPQTIFATSSLGVSAIDTRGWILPDTFPQHDAITSTVTSVEAFMTIDVEQTAGHTTNADWTTNIKRCTAYAKVSGSWTICHDMALTDVAIYVSAEPAHGDKPISFFADLTGVVNPDTTKVGITTYRVILSCSILRSADYGSAIIASATVMATSISVDTMLKMQFSGLQQVSVGDGTEAKTIPSEFPIQTAALLGQDSAVASLVFTKQQQNVWEMTKISAKINLAKGWVIIAGKIELTDASLTVIIENPRASQRVITFIAQANFIVTVGEKHNVGVTVFVSRIGETEDILTITISAGNARDVMNQLIGTDFKIPSGCPVLDSGYVFLLLIRCKWDPTTKSFKLDNITISITATPEKPWQLGQLSITQLAMAASYAGLNSDKKTTSVLFTGSAVMGSANAKLLLNYHDHAIDISITSAIAATDAVAPFSRGGLGASGTLNPPSITNDSGVGDYKTRTIIGAQIAFVEQGSVWKAESLTISLNNSHEWFIVNPELSVINIQLTLRLANLSGTPILSVTLDSKFQFLKRPDAQGHSSQAFFTGKLEATSTSLRASLDISECILPDFLYVATAGYWNAPDILDLPMTKGKTVALVLDWDAGVGSFTAICQDWSLSKTIPSLAGVKEPTLATTAYRSGGKLRATGQISGIAVVLGVDVSVSYDLASGPFRVAGIDINEARRLAKKLYEIFKDIQDMLEKARKVAQICAELAEFAEIAGTAAEVYAGLVAATVIASIAAQAVEEAYNGTHDNSSKSSSSGSSNQNVSSTATNHKLLVLGGSALSAGPLGQLMTLLVYPKDEKGAVLGNIVESKLSVLDSVGGHAVSGLSWSPIIGGFRTTFERPQASASTMQVIYELSTSEVLSVTFTSTIQQTASYIDLSKSALELPASVLAGDSFQTILRFKDQYGQQMIGNIDPSEVLMFINMGRGNDDVLKPDLILYNDAMVADISILYYGVFHIVVEVTTQSGIQKREWSLVVNDGLSVKSCMAYGPGLCTGKPNEATNFTVDLRTATFSYTPPSLSSLQVTISLECSNPSSLVPVDAQIIGSQIIAHYVRPSVLGIYTIVVMINNEMVNGKAYEVLCNSVDVSVSTAYSTVSLWQQQLSKSKPIVTQAPILIAPDDVIKGEIVAFDNNGQRYRQKTQDFEVVWSTGYQNISIASADDGTVSFSATAAVAAVSSTIQVRKKGNNIDHLPGSPFSVQVGEPRRLQDIILRGSGLTGLPLPNLWVFTDGYDQYGDPTDFLNSSTLFHVMTDANEIIQLESIDAPGLLGSEYSRPEAVKQAVVTRTTANIIEDIFLVNFDASGIASPVYSFIEFTNLTKDGICEAIVYVVDTAGRRKYDKGDVLDVFPDQARAGITVLDVTANKNGTFHVRFFVPAAAWSASGTAATKYGLNVVLNNQQLSGSAVTFLPSPPPIAKVNISGPGSIMAVIGTLVTATVGCEDAFGQATSANFHMIQAIMVCTTDSKYWLACNVSPITNGTITLSYAVPSGWPLGGYKLFVRLNDRVINSGGTTVNVLSNPLPVSNPSSVVSFYNPTQQGGDVMFWASGGGWGHADKGDHYEFSLPLPKSGFNFVLGILCINLYPRFDHNKADDGIFHMWDQAWMPVSSTFRSLNTPPSAWTTGSQSANQSSMVWTVKGGPGSRIPSDELVCDANNYASMLWLSTKVQNTNQWTTYGWQAGKLINSETWTPPNNLSQNGMTFTAAAMQGPDFNLKLKNVALMLQGDPPRSTPDNGTDIDFTQFFGQNYANLSTQTDLSFTASGLQVKTPSIDPQHPIIIQNDITQYGHRIVVYEFSVQGVLPIATQPEHYILFGGCQLDYATKIWTIPGGDNPQVHSTIDLSPDVFNRVTVVSGNGCTTIFENGTYVGVTMGAGVDDNTRSRHLISRGLWVIWKSLRVWPALRKAH